MESWRVAVVRRSMVQVIVHRVERFFLMVALMDLDGNCGDSLLAESLL